MRSLNTFSSAGLNIPILNTITTKNRGNWTKIYFSTLVKLYCKHNNTIFSILNRGAGARLDTTTKLHKTYFKIITVGKKTIKNRISYNLPLRPILKQRKKKFLIFSTNIILICFPSSLLFMISENAKPI